MYREYFLLGVQHRAVTTLRIQFNIEKSVVSLMEAERAIRRVKCIHHFDVCVQRNVVVFIVGLCHDLSIDWLIRFECV